MSYLKNALSAIRICAVPAAVFTLTSCGGGSGKPYDEAKDTPAGIYREYLFELRTQDRLSFEGLTARLGQWQTVRDSVSAHIRRDTLWRSHTDTRKECLLLHDSIRMDFPGWRCQDRAPIKRCWHLKSASLHTLKTGSYIAPRRKYNRFSPRWIAAWHTGAAKNNFCRRTARFSPRHSARAYTGTAT